MSGRLPRTASRRFRRLPIHAGRAEANSERYIVGPDSLAKFAPSIPPEYRGVPFQCRSRTGPITGPGKETTLVMFTYPTMEMARDRLPHFQQDAGRGRKATGPLVAVALNPASPDDAEACCRSIKYQAEVTLPEHVPT